MIDVHRVSEIRIEKSTSYCVGWERLWSNLLSKSSGTLDLELKDTETLIFKLLCKNTFLPRCSIRSWLRPTPVWSEPRCDQTYPATGPSRWPMRLRSMPWWLKIDSRTTSFLQEKWKRIEFHFDLRGTLWHRQRLMNTDHSTGNVFYVAILRCRRVGGLLGTA